jgi:hypothetical protein
MTAPQGIPGNVPDFLGPQLNLDERIDAVLTAALTGASWPVVIAVCAAAALIVALLGSSLAIGPVRTVVLTGVAALLTAGALLRFVARPYPVALTDQRLVLIRRSPRNGRLGRIESTYPRSAVRLIGYRPGPLFGSLKIGLSGQSALTFSFFPGAGRGAGQIAAALQTQPAT